MRMTVLTPLRMTREYWFLRVLQRDLDFNRRFPASWELTVFLCVYPMFKISILYVARPTFIGAYFVLLFFPFPGLSSIFWGFCQSHYEDRHHSHTDVSCHSTEYELPTRNRKIKWLFEMNVPGPFLVPLGLAKDFSLTNILKGGCFSF